MATVSLRGVRKSYGVHPVIHGVDLEIADGEFVVLVGPSGCGKSTLLRMIAGLEYITSGEVAIGRHVVNEEAPRDRDIAMVFQNYALYPHMSVADNMGFALMLKNVDKTAIDQRVRSTASILGLAPLLQRYPRELSGGQRQRVAMGRAIVRDPKVFLFDEPLSNLDAKLRVSMRAEMKSLHRRLRTTTVYVTHDQIEAMTLADRIVVMNEGIVQQVGRPLDVYAQPANTFVAGFIGSPAMNLIAGRLDRAASGLRLEDGSILPLGRAPDRPDGHAMIYGVRPEDISLAENGLLATLEVFEPMGAEAQAIVRMNDIRLTVVFRDRRSYEPGDVMRLAPDLGQVHLFDGDNGQRLMSSSL